MHTVLPQKMDRDLSTVVGKKKKCPPKNIGLKKRNVSKGLINLKIIKN
jgi:hypothetical protein